MGVRELGAAAKRIVGHLVAALRTLAEYLVSSVADAIAPWIVALLRGGVSPAPLVSGGLVQGED